MCPGHEVAAVAENVGKRGGTWFFRVDLPPGPDGRRHQKRVGGFPTERAARKALAQARVDVDSGRLRHVPQKRVDGFVTEWLDAVTPNRKASTAANYRILMEAYVLPRIGKMRLDRLSPADIQRLYTELRERGGKDGQTLSGTQVRNVHRVLHNALSYAERMGFVVRNPAHPVERPRDDTVERPVYTPDQVRAFLEAVAEDRQRALWVVAVTTGLRRGELAGLRWRDVSIDGERPTLAVRTTRTLAGRAVVEYDPKSKSSRRVIVLDPYTVDRLRDHRVAMEAEAILREDRLSEYVFADELGQPYHPRSLTRFLHQAQRRAGLPEITLHDLRHTAATVALLAGVHPKVVTERQGHSSTQITLDRYSHVVESMQEAAAAAIGDFLAAP
jgi:integrase